MFLFQLEHQSDVEEEEEDLCTRDTERERGDRTLK